VNWRALGCGLLAAAVFVLIGVFGIWRALAPGGCPPELPTEAGVWQPVGEPADGPRLPGVDEALEPAGEVGFGLATWELWVPPGTAPSASGEPLPERVVLRCDATTYQAYERTDR
jgi:hypothetical protein